MGRMGYLCKGTMLSHFIVLVMVVVPLLLAGCQRSEAPNIILITMDTTRADHLSCYGYGVQTTPNLDKIAKKGVRFDFAIAQSATTPVSCASQLTGRYPYHHGLRSMHGHLKNKLPADVPMLQGEFQQRHYKTAAFVSAYPASSAFGFSRGFQLFDEAFLKQGRVAAVTAEGVVLTGNSQRTAEETTKRVLPWLRKHARKPFFLWIHYFDPHDTNFVPPRAFMAPFLRSSPEKDKPEYLRSIYDAEIAFVDEHIGKVWSTLEELGIRDKTICVITADHGEGLGDHNWWTHGILYQEQIRVPLIMIGPGLPKGKVVEQMVEHVDIFPTLLDLVKPGWSHHVKGLDGHSLLPLLRGATEKVSDQPAYSEAHNVLAFGNSADSRQKGEMYSLILNKMKLIHLPRNSALDQLYDLKSDPHELHNLINVRREDADTLLKLLQDKGAIDHYVPNPATLSPQEREHLRSLGYLN